MGPRIVWTYKHPYTKDQVTVDENGKLTYSATWPHRPSPRWVAKEMAHELARMWNEMNRREGAGKDEHE